MDDGCSKDSDSCSHVHTEPITSLISLRNKWMGFVKVRKKRRAKSEDDGSTTMYDARYAEKRRFREAQGGSVPIWLERCTMDGTSWLVVSNHSSPFPILLPLSRVPHSMFLVRIQSPNHKTKGLQATRPDFLSPLLLGKERQKHR